MLSSDANPGNSTRRLKGGISGYAVKPVGRDQLLRVVCDALETSQGAEMQSPASVDRTEGQHVRPARILIAEDSPDNRLLVQAYLKNSPYQLIFEEDGRAAVDRFAASNFDLILMDVRMPVMDGLDATRAIRALERERNAPAIPIVALTANASLQDVERSSMAGCDGHLSKPVSKIELLRTIEKYRRQTPPPEGPQSESTEPIRIEMPDGLEDIVPGYLANRKREVSEMIGLLATSGFERMSFLGHNLKGTARGYGFPDLVRMGSALEQSANQLDRGTLHMQITGLGEYLDRVQLVAAGVHR
jgi:CheY-like chemotaxis protein/HPt (histidine-containing phosphotransfer) domain-containing protein